MKTANDETSGLKDEPIDLAVKYQEEKEKRLRSDGVGQFRNNADISLQFLYNPQSRATDIPRPTEPVVTSKTMTIVGCGWNGLILGAKLMKQGIDDFLIIDKGGNAGGAWYWNNYPGVMCDTESLIYLPFLEELGYMPSEHYVRGPEMLSYVAKIATKFKLYERSLFHTEVTNMDWDEAKSAWVIKTKQSDEITSKYVNITGGIQDKPKLPGLKGIESFQGKSFHSSRWDYNYTGGDTTGGLDKLKDKKVAIIGTGASAIQAVPHLAEHANRLYVFQRTPSGVDVRNNRPVSEDWYKTLKPGWQKTRAFNFHNWVTGTPDIQAKLTEDLIGDGWTWVHQNHPLKGITDPEKLMAAMLAGNDAKMNDTRARIDSIVKDPVTAEKLKPWYRWMCKRPCFHEDYLPSFNRPNVELVDTEGKGVDAITPKGVLYKGHEYEVDCIIYATGFYVGTDWSSPTNVQIHGRGGLHLAGKWKDGHRTLHGMMTHDFPNFFLTGIEQSTFPGNAPTWLQETADYKLYVLAECERRGVKTIEPSVKAEEAWTQKIIESAKAAHNMMASCTPSYFNDEGRVRQDKDFASGMLSGVGTSFYEQLEQWRANGTLEGMEMH